MFKRYPHYARHIAFHTYHIFINFQTYVAGKSSFFVMETTRRTHLTIQHLMGGKAPLSGFKHCWREDWIQEVQSFDDSFQTRGFFTLYINYAQLAISNSNIYSYLADHHGAHSVALANQSKGVLKVVSYR